MKLPANMFFRSDNELLAFVHIEKAAGTTLIHLLRSNFFMKYCDVKPLSSTSNRVVTSDDMKKVLCLNPALRCIGGHAVKPFSDLRKVFPQVRYFTLLRDPIRRYLSLYQYWLERLGKKLSFQSFLDVEGLFNFQTKKIAGTDNLHLAKKTLSKDFFLVGIVESFDEFLILFRNKLKPFEFSPYYEVKNVGNNKSPIRKSLPEIFVKYKDEIIKRNQLDIELYDYVKTVLLPREKVIYGPNFDGDLNLFKNSNNGYSLKNQIFLNLDCMVRKCYYELIFGIIRKKNGLPPKGFLLTRL